MTTQYRPNIHAKAGRICPLCGYGIHPRSQRPICRPCWEGRREHKVTMRILRETRKEGS